MTLEALKVQKDGAVVFVEISTQPRGPKPVGAALKRGFQTREAEMDLARLLGDLPDGDQRRARHVYV